MVSKVRGRFSDFAGTVEIAENPFESSVAVTIQTASVDTRDELPQDVKNARPTKANDANPAAAGRRS